MAEDAFLRMENVRKAFPGVVANDDVDFSVRRGEIHGLLGENGAGKSTLMNVLYGLYTRDGGTVELDGEPLDPDSPADAIAAGVGMVHQHFMLVPRLTVAENVVLGEREPAGPFRADAEDSPVPASLRENRLIRGLAERFSLGLEAPRERIADLAGEYGFEVDPDARVRDLTVGQRQRVEILKALYRDVDLLVLDEPTAVLTPAEAERLFETLRRLAEDGLAVVFITHKLEEATAVTDRVTVLRDGERVDTVDTASVSRQELARMMVGRDVLFELDRDPVDAGEVVLETADLRVEDDRGVEAVSGVDLELRRGEVLGVAGVGGNGQAELAEALAGVRPARGGRIVVDGVDLTGRPSRAFVDAGVSYVPEDRHDRGCAPGLSVMHNAALKAFRGDEFGEGAFLEDDRLREHAERLVEEYDVRGVHDVAEMPAGDLSGGNLQKLILGRELSREPDLLVAHQPTRGVDVGAIEFLRRALLDARASGTGVLLLSEDLDELFDLSDRIAVLYEGEVVHETTPGEADRETVGLAMTGAAPDGADGGEAEGTTRPEQAATDGGDGR